MILFLFLVLVLVPFLWLLPIWLARGMGRTLELPNAWLWGLFLGWLGVLVLFLKMPGRMRKAMTDAGMSTSLSGAAKDAAAFKQRLMGEGGKKCPDCAENVQADAKVCRFCGHHFEVVEAPAELA